ncbi:MAG: hypothetical protein P4L64_15205 [Caulobacteraceae bacterium]|nr:hypothetical protein [Caulobacteraceae bacterium]
MKRLPGNGSYSGLATWNLRVASPPDPAIQKVAKTANELHQLERFPDVLNH